MKQAVRWLFAVSFVIAVAVVARAQERGTPADAKQMVEDALAHIKQVGPAQAFEDFSTPGGKWHKKDIYLFCYDLQGTCTCQGANKADDRQESDRLQIRRRPAFYQEYRGYCQNQGQWLDRISMASSPDQQDGSEASLYSQDPGLRWAGGLRSLQVVKSCAEMFSCSAYLGGGAAAVLESDAVSFSSSANWWRTLSALAALGADFK